MSRYDDIDPQDIDPDTGRPYENYSSPALETSFHDHEMDVELKPENLLKAVADACGTSYEAVSADYDAARARERSEFEAVARGAMLQAWRSLRDGG